MFKPTPGVVAALRERLDSDGLAVLDAELALRRPDLTAILLRAAADPAPLPRDLLAAVCRAGCTLLGKRHPGASIEVRVPPFAAVQIGFDAGPRHTRGTPPNVVELDGDTFAALATGRLAWADAAVRASGVHAHEAARAFPLTACPETFN
ncbi:MAG: sterol carrier family protein [Propionibacteriaceae bacterium]|nr:sterol carrier family protein [Propionibacteriaceae bacterium]